MSTWMPISVHAARRCLDNLRLPTSLGAIKSVLLAFDRSVVTPRPTSFDVERMAAVSDDNHPAPGDPNAQASVLAIHRLLLSASG